MSDVEPVTIIQNILHEIGYRAEALDDSAVGSAASGLKFYIQLYGPSIQFRCSLGLDGSPGDWADFINSFNKDMRFAKIYIMDEDTLIVEADWTLDPIDEGAPLALRSALDFWEVSLSELKDRLVKRANAENSRHEDVQ